jgi:hypothetical protein
MSFEYIISFNESADYGNLKICPIITEINWQRFLLLRISVKSGLLMVVTGKYSGMEGGLAESLYIPSII